LEEPAYQLTDLVDKTFQLRGLLFVVVVAASCGNAIDSEARINGEVSEWAVAIDETSAPTGDLTFRVRNSGTIDHEFLVVKTDLADGTIPVEGGLFAEDQEGIEVVDEIPPFAAGRTEELTITLDAGQYQLV
jgi:hypothetical protein